MIFSFISDKQSSFWNPSRYSNELYLVSYSFAVRDRRSAMLNPFSAAERVACPRQHPSLSTRQHPAATRSTCCSGSSGRRGRVRSGRREAGAESGVPLDGGSQVEGAVLFCWRHAADGWPRHVAVALPGRCFVLSKFRRRRCPVDALSSAAAEKLFLSASETQSINDISQYLLLSPHYIQYNKVKIVG